MIRLFHAIGAVAASSCFIGLDAPPRNDVPTKPAMIGTSQPVFLGRMTVTASSLPMK